MIDAFNDERWRANFYTAGETPAFPGADALSFTRQAGRLRSQELTRCLLHGKAGRLRSQECLRSSQGLFGDMLCEHIQCRLESRRARRGSADALVGVGGWVTHLRLPWERGRLARCVVVAEGRR